MNEMDKILDWKNVRDRIVLSVVNDKSVHEDEPRIELPGDLSLVYKIHVDSDEEDTSGFIRFKMNLLRKWQEQYPTVTEQNFFESIFEVAKANTERMFRPVYVKVPEGLVAFNESDFNQNKVEAVSDAFTFGEPKILVVTTDDAINGATVVFNSYVLSGIAEEYDDDLILVFSSPYECVIHPAHGEFTESTIKASLVSLEEPPLSEKLYYYNSQTTELTVI